MSSRLTLLLLLIALAGCTTTEAVGSRDVAAVSWLDARVRGRTVDVDLRDGRERGRIAFVRLDSVAWDRDGERRAVATSQVLSLSIDPRGRNARRGLAVGALLGTAAYIVAGRGEAESIEGVATRAVFRVGAIPAGAFYGPILGALWEPRRVWQLSPAAQTTGRDPRR